MTGHIFNIQDDGTLLEMSEETFDTEDVFQDLLAKYPNLLAGDQIQSENPRRWLLIRREMGVPSEESGGDRWSLDHLFIDQDAVPTLVEVKRSSDTRIRREVVGQMLDYAANAVVYWPVEKIKAEFEANCTSDGADPAARLSEFLGGDVSPEEFWTRAKTNLQAGKIRLLFVADVIPPELHRIIEFLNEQMDPAEVLGIELRQYVGEGVRSLVPRVVGQTAQAERRKHPPGKAKPPIDEAQFLADMGAQVGAAAVDATRQLIAWTRDKLGEAKWSSSTFSAQVTHANVKYILFYVWLGGGVLVQLKGLGSLKPFNEKLSHVELVQRVSEIPGIEMREVQPGTHLKALSDQLAIDKFLEVMDWIVQEIERA